jgi:hypothetical protein
MRSVLAVALAGCSFSHGQLPTDNGTRDDALVDVALPDAPDGPADGRPDAAADAETFCHVGVASTTGTDRGRVGGDGGGDNFPALLCANAADRIVGVALKMSNQNTTFGQRSAQGVRIGCAPVTVNNSGVGTTGTTVTTYEVLGNGNFGWSPSTWTAMTMCKPGWIIAGMSTHTTSGGDLFVDSAITCAQIGASGTVVATEVLSVAGSLTESQGFDSATCNTGEILVRMSNRTGAGLDSVNLWCTTPTCN